MGWDPQRARIRLPGVQAVASSPLCFRPTEDSDIRCEQLNMLQDWLADFRKSTSSSSAANPEELVAFDVICGDFNFDNCSSGEAGSYPLGSTVEEAWALLLGSTEVGRLVRI